MPDPRIEELGDAECRELLAGRHLGRLALVDDRGPVILPVNYVVDGDAPVFRTDPGTKLDAAAEGAAVAFEGDKARYLRVAPVSLTGRRIRIPDELPFTWWG